MPSPQGKRVGRIPPDDRRTEPWKCRVLRSSDIPVAELLQTARRPEVLAIMQDFYRELDERIAALPATCWNSGACCHFGKYGHRLFVTALEAAYYIGSALRAETHCASRSSPEGDARRTRTSLPILSTPAVEEDACPHAYTGQCHARDRRPMGCRIFYCDPAAQQWQGPLTEEMLTRLRRLHDELGVEYFYADWMAVLQALRADLISPES